VYPVFEFCAGGETVDNGDGAPLRQFLGAELKKEKLPAYKVRLAEAVVKIVSRASPWREASEVV